MPSADEIVASLAAIARSWQLPAIGWHVYFGVLVSALIAGFRPSRRLFGLVLVPPMLSVSALAWLASNPFNGIVFAIAALVLAVLAARFDAVKVQAGPWPFMVAGGLLFAFGWVYPHFVDAASIFTYLYATPLGLIPCPTLSAIVGLAVMLGGLGSLAWSGVLGLVGVFYGVYGAAVLGVTIDWVLAAGSICVLLAPYTDR